MKRYLWIVISLSLLLTVIAIGGTGCESLSPPSRTTGTSGFVLNQQNTGIWVTGEGEISVTPDVAILSLGVEAQAATVNEAQTQAAAAMDAVIRQLDNYDVAEKDIKTRYFSIYPVRKWVPDKEEEVLIGYRVNNMVTAKIREVADTGTIIDALTLTGGDYIRINNISFTVDDPSAYHEEVRKEAMADAATKAKQLADSSGVKLGEPIYINEGGGYVSPITYPAEAVMPVPAPAPSPTPISPGETEIRLTVQVAYSIE